MLKIWVDGSCLNNQGPDKVAACRIVTETGVVRTIPLGNTSNNIAEIEAIRRGLEYAVEVGLKEVEILSDSQVALSWIRRGREKGPENCISKHSTLPEDRKALVRASVGAIFALMEKIRRVEINWCPDEEQKADFGNKKGKRKAR